MAPQQSGEESPLGAEPLQDVALLPLSGGDSISEARQQGSQRNFKVASQREEESLAMMVERFPNSPEAELLRFCRARPLSTQEAISMYEEHLQWRESQGTPERLLKASMAVPSKYVRPCGVASDGSPLILVQGARFDAGVDVEEYLLACAAALDSVVAADDARKVTILVDVRPGEGWPNMPAAKMMPLLRLMCSALPGNFPERCQRVVIYPMPAIVSTLWWAVARLLDPVTREKFVVLSGSAALDSPCPKELGKYVELDQLPADAHSRHASLVRH